MPINIRDVAREAGVSVSTASRVIRQAGYVSQSTRQRVLEAVEKLKYRPNIVARRLKYGRTFTIGFVMNDIANPFFGHAVKGAERYIRESGGQDYELILFNTSGEPYREIKALETMADKRVEGIIIASTASPNCIELIHKIENESNIPIVSIDNELGGKELGVVSADNISGAYQLVSHLITRHQYTSFGIISGPAQESHARDRLNGALKALNEADIKPEADYIQYGKWTYIDGYNITLEWIRRGKCPRVIFASNNFMCLGAISVLRDKNIAVPEEVAVVSFDDIQFGHLFRPRLTSLDYSWDGIGRETARLILEGINAENIPEHPIQVRLPVNLLVRESCGCINI